MRESVASTEIGGAAPASDTPEGARRIGRFTLLQRLGRGGMGEVFTAWDPQLDRRVAIKLLRAERDDVAARARLLREAQAMARLSHPNVVQVFEAGLTEPPPGSGDVPRVFIAMEFVQGRTLRGWLGDTSPDVDAIIAAFVQAGSGLVAAHAAGLVHRDFKPDNVLVGDDGRIRVADLGLARAVASPLSDRDERATTDGGAPQKDDDRITATGVAAGTPAYMAPEQFLGEDVDARADQFAFCVAMWEALHGERPFAGATRIEIATAVVDGEPRPAPRGVHVPAWVQDLLRIGLSRQPSSRHPSMAVLLQRLAHDPRRRRRRAALFGAGALALAGSVWLGTELAGSSPTRSPCAGAAADLEAVWAAPHRDALVAAMSATPAIYASRVADRVVADLDAYAAAWTSSAQDACEATRVRGEQSEALFDRRRRCLDRRRRDLSALLSVLAQPDAALLERAPEAVRALPAIARCDDAEFVSAQVEPPSAPELAAQVELLRDRTAHVDALRNAGRAGEAFSEAMEALGEARSLPYPPIVAEVLLAAGQAADSAGDAVSAEPLLRESYLVALRESLDDTAAGAATRLVYTVGHRLSRLADAGEWAAHASALLARPGTDPLRRISLLNHEAAVAWHHGDYARAEQGFAEVFTRWKDAHGARSPQVAIVLSNLGALAYARGDATGAASAYEEVLSIMRERMGEDHPETAGALGQLGAAYWLKGDLARALDHFERALQSLRASRGEDHPDVAQVLLNLAGVEAALERYPDARDHVRRACAFYEAREGAQGESLGRCLHNWAVVEHNAGLQDEARDLGARGLAILRQALPEDHPEVVRGIRLAAEIAEARGETEAALRGWSDVLAIRERSGASPSDLGDARFGLARARFTGRGGEDDRAAVRGAEAAYAELVADGAQLEAENVRAWLSARGVTLPGE